jgi:hypothetical protein
MFDRSRNSAARELENTAGPHKHSSWSQATIQMVREKLSGLIWPEITTGSNWHRSYQSRSGKE